MLFCDDGNGDDGDDGEDGDDGFDGNNGDTCEDNNGDVNWEGLNLFAPTPLASSVLSSCLFSIFCCTSSAYFLRLRRGLVATGLLGDEWVVWGWDLF